MHHKYLMQNITPQEEYSVKSKIRDAMIEWLSSKNWNYYVTFNFNAHTTLASGKTTLKRFHAMLDRKLYGRNFNILNSDQRTLFIAFPEHVESNLHYHAMLSAKNPNFPSMAEKIWKSLVPSGRLHIIALKEAKATEADYHNIARYSTKELSYKERYSDFIISSQFSTV